MIAENPSRQRSIAYSVREIFPLPENPVAIGPDELRQRHAVDLSLDMYSRASVMCAASARQLGCGPFGLSEGQTRHIRVFFGNRTRSAAT